MKKSLNKGTSEQEKIVETLLHDKIARLATVRRSLSWFFIFYFPHYVKYPTAPFQTEMMRSVEDASVGIVVIVAFRGSAKSTIVTTAYPLWAMLGTQGKKHVLILSQTKEKAQQHFANIKQELETNERLMADLGPFQEEQSPWGMQSLVIKGLDARISVGSVGQSIRGVRHRAHRPDLIVLDDIEDLQSVKTKEGRDRTWQWLTGEVVPSGDVGTRIVAVGNLLHADAVMPRLGRAIEKGEISGVFRQYPVVDERGLPLWTGKYPTALAVEEERRKIMDEAAWQREFMLRIVPTTEQVVWQEWIKTYRDLPKESPRYRAIGVDLASSLEESADFTAMVPVAVYGYGADMRVYVLPPVVNERLTFPVATERAIALSKALGDRWRGAKIVIEDNGFQKAFVQQLNSMRVEAEGVTSVSDKRSRLCMTTHMLQQGRVLFPEHGAEALTEQLVGFGKELHDDLADAFSLIVNYAMGKNFPGVRVIDGPRIDAI